MSIDLEEDKKCGKKGGCVDIMVAVEVINLHV
jgi:hypothetical protein